MTHRAPWLAAQSALANAMTGQVVGAWRGIEMAVRDETESGPQFGDPEVACVQLFHLTASLVTGAAVTVTTCQDDDRFGLIISNSGPTSAQATTGIYRATALHQFPVGKVESIRAYVEDGVQSELLLTIDGARLLLIAGEISEHHDGSLAWHRFDESVLAFTDIASADRAPWTPSRPPTETWSRP